MGICCGCTRAVMGQVQTTDKSCIQKLWHFRYGTIVQGPCTLQESLQKMKRASRDPESFFASHIIDNLYEVQFTRDVYPEVIVVVPAQSGLEAGMRGRYLLAMDYASPEVLHIS